MPIPLAIKLQAGTKEFYQLNKLTKNNAFHRAGNSITKAVKKEWEEDSQKEGGGVRDSYRQTEDSQKDVGGKTDNWTIRQMDT